jgi:hypothetical protein
MDEGCVRAGKFCADNIGGTVVGATKNFFVAHVKN